MSDLNIKINPLPHGSEQPKKQLEKEIGQLSLDIFDHEDEIIILAPIAGVNEEDVTLSITDDVLTLKGTRAEKYEVKEENYYSRECFWGSFSRAIVLPLEADTKNIAANFTKNILEIRIPKKEINRTNIIKIKQ